MKVAIFAAMTGRQSGGPESYEIALIHALTFGGARNEYSIYCVNSEAASIFRQLSSKLSVRRLWPSFRWISFTLSLPIQLLLNPHDIVHATYVAPPFLPGRLVFTLHDLSPFSNPEFYPPAIRLRLQRGFAQSIRRADEIICVSEFTLQHLAERFPTEAARARVIHHGVDDIYRRVRTSDEIEQVLGRLQVRRPYILCLGKLQARKNTIRIIEAFHQLKKETRAPHKLVMAGRKMWTSSEVYPLVRRLGLEDDIVFPGHVADNDLPALYRGAEVLVFPSLFEGFGMPVLEAMASGCPVVTSNVTSLPEVAGDAAVLVDPTRTEDIANGIHSVLRDGGFRNQLIERGLIRASHYTWARTAAEVMKVYAEVGTSGRGHLSA